jgi:hypothetical protein
MSQKFIRWDCDLNLDKSASCQRNGKHRPETMAVYRRKTCMTYEDIARLCINHIEDWESKYPARPVEVCPQCFEEHP